MKTHALILPRLFPALALLIFFAIPGSANAVPEETGVAAAADGQEEHAEAAAVETHQAQEPEHAEPAAEDGHAPAGAHAPAGGHGAADLKFPRPLAEYEVLEAEKAAEMGKQALSLWEVLKFRVALDPFNIIATLIFLMAILHTFASGYFRKWAHQEEEKHKELIKQKDNTGRFVGNKEPVSFKATILHFLGEVEAIFGIWLLPLIGAILFLRDWEHATFYLDTRNYTEPIFVVVIMCIAATRPVLKMAEGALSMVAGLGKRSPAAWWLSILTIAPLLGSFITEPAAMTIAALLLGEQFYRLNPTPRFKYATLGLLFVNVSVGGTLTHFAAPPVLMVAGTWNWDIGFMFTHFGWRAFIGIIVSNVIYYAAFRKNFADLKSKVEQRRLAGEDDTGAKAEEPVPVWIIIVHLLFLAWTVFTLHHIPLFIGAFLFFIAFTIATEHHQYQISLKGPLLVGFFLAGLVTHGGLQGWWIAPVLSSLSEVPLFISATVLTAFNDNAAITFLASQVPAFSQFAPGDAIEVMKSPEALETAVRLQYSVVAGAVTGGGLTVIANAPNPAGQSILSKYFDNGVSPIWLLAGAIIPTIVMGLCFMGLPH